MREDFTYPGLLNDTYMSSKFEVVYQEIIQMKFIFLFVFDATHMDEEIRIQLSLRFWTDTGWVCKDGEATGFVVAWESGEKCVWKCFSKNMYLKVLSLNAYINHLQLVSMGLTNEIGSWKWKKRIDWTDNGWRWVESLGMNDEGFQIVGKKSTVVKNVSSNQASVCSSSASGQKLDVVGYVPVRSIKPSYNNPYNSRTSVSNRLDKYVGTLLNHVKDGQQSNDSNVVAGLLTVVHSLGRIMF
ncbi:hypothetical protein HanOQP8_Chr05g0180161 [Helianthus annuus]|nr:hypothetical protein HanIR_Chr05g0222821 [Helianthus annuus]KAJ0746631.1 hypothetical protein HanOQP8_Chr05g0180161 [Helianthus annuus]